MKRAAPISKKRPIPINSTHGPVLSNKLRIENEPADGPVIKSQIMA